VTLETPPAIHHYHEEVENVVQVNWTPAHDNEPYLEVDRRPERAQDFTRAIDDPQLRQQYLELLPDLPRERNVPLELLGVGSHFITTGEREPHLEIVHYKRDLVLSQFNRD
jgi:hypothetical protein